MVCLMSNLEWAITSHFQKKQAQNSLKRPFSFGKSCYCTNGTKFKENAIHQLDTLDTKQLFREFKKKLKKHII